MAREPSVDGRRLWSRLMEMASIGATDKGGVCRLALTDLDREGRDLFCRWASEAGCQIDIDSMGNIFARRAGTDPAAAPVAAGSHLDSQPTGGKYDGALGVLAALEVIEALNDAGIATVAPVEAVAWTNEEGARFAPAMIGSGVHAGEFDLAYAHSRTDRDGHTLGEELARIGYRGDTECGTHALGAHFELHIEQGPILERENIEIGVLTGVQGIRWYELAIEGSEAHAGPTPMNLRRDPVPVLAKIIPDIYAAAAASGEAARCTLGIVNAEPGSPNTVPGKVRATIDLRHPDARELDRMDERLQAVAASHGNEPCPVVLNEIWHSPPITFAPSCIEAVAQAAAACGLSAKRMVSGAGHDSVYLSKVAPTGMIFVPCKDGLSHNELEETSPQQAANGANVLLRAVLGTAGRARRTIAGPSVLSPKFLAF